MASKVEICNLALSRLATNRITSLSDNTIEAKQCNAIYDEVADDVMSLGPWPSTITRATLAQTATTPTYEYTYEYQLPTLPKCLRVLRINEQKAGDIDFQIEGDKLLTDEATVDIKYIGRVTDTEQYDSYLKQAIVWRLVAEMAYKFTGQASVTTTLVTTAEQRIDQLLNIASGQGSNEDLPSDIFTDIRR
jgi:hypothetical protein